ncbi:MAG: class I SAM-dependent methyltransferase [Terrimicrobiaceae bacterium]|nr:class I SAM-dependent methyltransferase [Terrimicrobiaceae bacterium]
MNGTDHRETLRALRDDHFDLIFPPEIRALSHRHWTPVSVACRAAEFLVSRPGTRVLDIGCGPGKFCIVGALTTPGHFTGVEQRGRLGSIARSMIEEAGIPNARIIHANVTEIDFSGYDAFYLFNPFAENLLEADRIDGTVDLSQSLYQKYAEHVAAQLASAPLGTRVATYWGPFDEIPVGYECLDTSLADTLKFWEKTRHAGADGLPAEAPASHGERRPSCDSAVS